MEPYITGALASDLDLTDELMKNIGWPVNDSDGDGVVDTADNCPSAVNPDQLNTDGADDGGDACDDDDDDDAWQDFYDNCPLISNPDQLNSDSADDGGDACDDDDDNDSKQDASDNCPLKSNANQADKDGDGIGNVCDPDYVPSGCG